MDKKFHMDRPLVSVCIVTYNHERYIYDCIMSVLAQSRDFKLEVLVGDDLSEDRTSATVKAIASDYPHIIRYFRHSCRLGPAANYQFLIKRARGAFIAHLDGDDYWLPGKLNTQISFLNRHPDFSAVYSNAIVISDDGFPIGLFNNPQPEKFGINDLLSRGNFLNNSSMIYRTALKDSLLSEESPFIDYHVHLSHARRGPVGYVNQAFVAYRMGSSSSMIVHANDTVRQLYWDAMLHSVCDLVDAYSLAQGMAEFVRSVFFRSVRMRKTHLLRRWVPTVMKASPVGRIRMAALIIAAVLRVGCRETLSAVWLRISRNPLKILYHR